MNEQFPGASFDGSTAVEVGIQSFGERGAGVGQRSHGQVEESLVDVMLW